MLSSEKLGSFLCKRSSSLSFETLFVRKDMLILFFLDWFFSNHYCVSVCLSIFRHLTLCSSFWTMGLTDGDRSNSCPPVGLSVFRYIGLVAIFI